MNCHFEEERREISKVLQAIAEAEAAIEVAEAVKKEGLISKSEPLVVGLVSKPDMKLGVLGLVPRFNISGNVDN